MNSTRREFVSGLTLAGTAGLLGTPPDTIAAESPPETPRIRLVQDPSVCLAPLFVAEELLRAEGFAEVEYVPIEGGVKRGAPFFETGPHFFIPILPLSSTWMPFLAPREAQPILCC
jgi:hypothetical protein